MENERAPASGSYTLATVALCVGDVLFFALLARGIVGADRFGSPNDATSWIVDLLALAAGLAVLAFIIDRRHPRQSS